MQQFTKLLVITATLLLHGAVFSNAELMFYHIPISPSDVMSGSMVQFPCMAEHRTGHIRAPAGEHPPERNTGDITYSWLKDGQDLNPAQLGEEGQEEKVGVYKEHLLTLRNLTMEDSGTYQCVATLGEETVTAQLVLRVHDFFLEMKPSINELTVAVKISPEVSDLASQAVLQYRKASDVRGQWQSISGSLPTPINGVSHVTLTDLEPRTRYKLRVARPGETPQDQSELPTFESSTLCIPAEDGQISITQIDVSSVLVTFLNPDDVHQCPPSQYYISKGETRLHQLRWTAQVIEVPVPAHGVYTITDKTSRHVIQVIVPKLDRFQSYPGLPVFLGLLWALSLFFLGLFCYKMGKRDKVAPSTSSGHHRQTQQQQQPKPKRESILAPVFRRIGESMRRRTHQSTTVEVTVTSPSDDGATEQVQDKLLDQREDQPQVHYKKPLDQQVENQEEPIDDPDTCEIVMVSIEK